MCKATVAPDAHGDGVSAVVHEWDVSFSNANKTSAVSLEVDRKSSRSAFELVWIVRWQRQVRTRLTAKARQDEAVRRVRINRAGKVIVKNCRRVLSRIERPCPICFEHFSWNSLKGLTSAGVACHRACASCAAAYVDSQLLDGRLYVRCPGEGCKNVLDSQIVRKAASATALQKYEETMMAKHSSRLLDEDDETFLAFCAEYARLCPACSVIIWRYAGCNHMRCKCGTLFNWDDPEVNIEFAQSAQLRSP